MDTDINKEAEAAAKEMEGQDLADPNKPGLIEAMNQEFDPEEQKPDAKVSPSDDLGASEALGSEDEVKKVAEAAKSTESSKDESSSEEEASESDKGLEIDEEFFSEEEQNEESEETESKDESFDESAFDKETAAVIKTLEEKGHPGDVYKQVREQLKEAKQATISPEQQAEVEELKLKVQEAEGLRARIDELSNQSAKLKVENSPEYEAQILKPAEQIFRRAEEIASGYEGGDADVIKAIIRETDRKTQNEMVANQLKEMSDFDRSEVYGMARDFHKLVNQRELMLDDAEKSIEKFEAARIEQEQQAREEQRKNVLSVQKEIWEKYEDKIPGLLDENGKQTDTLKSLMAKGMSIDFSKAKSRDQAYASFAGVILPHLVKQMNQMESRLSEYESNDEKAARKSASPGKTVAPQVKSSEKEPEGFMARLANVDLV